MKHGKKATPPGPLVDPNATHSVLHSCGHHRTYTDLPKFDPDGLRAEVEARRARPCRACKERAKPRVPKGGGG